MYKIKLSPYHKIFYNEWQLDPLSSKYNIVFDQTISSNLDIPRLRKALHRFVSDYLIVNSHVEEVEGEAYWVPNTRILELEHFETQYTKEQLFKYIAKPFDIESGPLYRIAIFNEPDGNYRLVFILHHLIIDGNSFDILISELSNYYNLHSYTSSYSISTQENMLRSTIELYDKQLEQFGSQYKQFWGEQLANVVPPDLRWAKSENNKDEIKEYRFNFTREETAKFIPIIRKLEITEYIYSQCIFAILLHKYTSQGKFGFSYPIAVKGSLPLVSGACVNTNISIYEFHDTTTIMDLFQQNKNFIKLVKGKNRDVSQYPINCIINNINKDLLDVMFAKTNLKDRPFNFIDVKMLKINSEFNIDLPAQIIFEFERQEYTLNFRIRYKTLKIDETILGNFISHYKHIFLKILVDLEADITNKVINEYQVLTEKEYKYMVHAWNNPCESYLVNKTVIELFEEQVINTPNNIAVVFENFTLTYAELNIQSNKLAHHLKAQYAIKGDDLIVLCLDRSLYMLIAVLGVLKAGGAYVPIEPKYPKKRISYILEDTKAKVIITNECHYNTISTIFNQINKRVYAASQKTPVWESSVMLLDSQDIQNKLIKSLSSNPEINITTRNLAYVMYTSGTTGNPKGVMLEHYGVSVRIISMIKKSGINTESRYLFKTNYMFDVSFSDIFMTLLSGASLYVTKSIFDIDEICNLIIKNSINVCHFVPSQLDLVRDYLSKKGLFEKLQTINLSGEKFNKSFIDKTSKVKYVNYYGPTETGEVSYDITDLKNQISSHQHLITIGYPLKFTTLYVLDNYLRPLPIGAIGELYIGGPAIARAYLNLPELTQKVFVPNPFLSLPERSEGSDARLYKTGDLVRYLPDGNIEYIGRRDLQIKIRGYRIEPAEVENHLLKMQDIKQAVVIVEKNSSNRQQTTEDNYIVAYYVAERKLEEADIVNFLKDFLPEYMIPSFFVYLRSLPLTLNGKVDVPELPKIKLSDNYVAPKNQIQALLVEMWAEILQLPPSRISITDSFFKLGGNSLLIIKLQNQLSKIDVFKNIKTTDLFRYTTIEKLIRWDGIENSENNISLVNAVNCTESDIAIIGISGAFSGCEDIEQYWDLIKSGQEGLSTATIEEYKRYKIPPEVFEDPSFIPRSGHVPDIDKFDVDFWEVTPEEAKHTDPQIRKFLEHCWYALETAGYSEILHTINIGVYVGISDSAYNTNLRRQPIMRNPYGNLNIKDSLATTVSYLLNLRGSSNNINTACSSGLVTVVEACRGLASGYCDMAISGSTALLLPEEIGYIYHDGMIFSKDGHCRPFDSNASGTVLGSGLGVVLLKRLADAERDNDNILAVIKGYATNNDGNRKISYTAPSIAGQKECILKAHNMAQVSSDQIDYVECHGTATRLGDPIEVEALDEAFKYSQVGYRTQKCVLGSSKAHIGHTRATSGIAGLIKVCKMFKDRIIPAQINFDVSNPELDIENTNFIILKKTINWTCQGSKPRLAGVSSFGVGGTNAHIILSEYLLGLDKKLPPRLISPSINNYILPLSAKSELSLIKYKNVLIKYLAGYSGSLENIIYTLQQKRKHFDYRLSVVCSSIEDAINKLNVNANISKISLHKSEIILVFPAHGNEYVNMSYGLYSNEASYKTIIDDCIVLINRYTGVKFENILFPKNNESYSYDVNESKWAQLALFIVNYSLAKLLESLNIKVGGYIGYGIGELIAATLSGVFMLEDAIKIVIARENLQQRIQKHDALCMQSSDIIDSKVKQFIKAFEGIRLSKPNSKFISNVTGDFITDLDALSLEYWGKQMISKGGLFTDGVKQFWGYGEVLFIEIATGDSSSLPFIEQSNSAELITIPLSNSLKGNVGNMTAIMCKEDILNKLWMAGYSIDFKYNFLLDEDECKLINLPNYQFDSKSYWIPYPEETGIWSGANPKPIFIENNHKENLWAV